MEIRLLQLGDERFGFRSGDPDLDGFFHKYAGQNQFRHHIGTTYVAVHENRLLGFATVAPGQIEIENLPFPTRRKLPRYPLPVLRLARLATDESARARGIGKALLRHILLLAKKMSIEYGCFGVLVDAKPAASEFYARFGFFPLDLSVGALGSRPRPVALFLPLDEIGA